MHDGAPLNATIYPIKVRYSHTKFITQLDQPN